MPTLWRLANTHPFWCAWLSPINIIGVLALLAIAIFQHTPNHVPNVFAIGGVALYGIAVLFDYKRYSQAKYVAQNWGMLKRLMQDHKFSHYLASIASNGDELLRCIDTLDEPAQRDKHRFCLEYLKYLRLARRTR